MDAHNCIIFSLIVKILNLHILSFLFSGAEEMVLLFLSMFRQDVPVCGWQSLELASPAERSSAMGPLIFFPY